MRFRKAASSLTTHNKGVIESIGRRVITMEKGRIIRDDKDGKYAL